MTSVNPVHRSGHENVHPVSRLPTSQPNETHRRTHFGKTGGSVSEHHNHLVSLFPPRKSPQFKRRANGFGHAFGDVTTPLGLLVREKSRLFVDTRFETQHLRHVVAIEEDSRPCTRKSPPNSAQQPSGRATHALERVLEGELDQLLDPLITHAQAEALKAAD